jgi:hypothetical protein
MHAPAPTTTETPLGGIAPFVSQQHYHGNRVAICQECYERADGGAVALQKIEPHMHGSQDKRWVYRQACKCPRCTSITLQITSAQKLDDARRLAEQAKPMHGAADVPPARAKLEMPTAKEVRVFYEDFACFAGGARESIERALKFFIARRNEKL